MNWHSFPGTQAHTNKQQEGNDITAGGGICVPGSSIFFYTEYIVSVDFGGTMWFPVLLDGHRITAGAESSARLSKMKWELVEMCQRGFLNHFNWKAEKNDSTFRSLLACLLKFVRRMVRKIWSPRPLACPLQVPFTQELTFFSGFAHKHTLNEIYIIKPEGKLAQKIKECGTHADPLAIRTLLYLLWQSHPECNLSDSI